MAHSYKNIVITPNIGANTDPFVQFSGGNTTVNTDVTLRVYPDSNGTLSFEGSAGQLFSITNDLSGSVFAVNDVSGIPLVEVNVASQQITLGEFYGNVGIGKSSSTSSIYKLDVNGTINASNVLINGNAITGGATSLTPANNWANTVGTAGNNYTNSVGIAGNNYASVLAANNAIGANGWANTVGTAGNNYTNSVGVAGNNYASVLAANNAIGANNWANTLSTTDKAIANNYANAVGAASNAYAATLGVNTSLAYTWTNTHTYQNTVTFSSNVFFRNTSHIVWITNAASTTSNVTLKNYPDSNGTLSFEGSAGQLFSITNDLTGSLFAVNDVSGIPLVEVNVTSQQITFGEFYGNVGIGKSSSTSSIYKLDVNGTINASNILINTVPVLVSLTPANNWANTVGTAGNNYTNTVGASSNAYTNAVGAAGNNYASILASNNAIGANGWANTVGTAGNNYTNTVGTAGNNYTNTVGTAGNNYASILAANNAVGANAWANSINTFSTSTYVRLTAPSQTITGSLSITGNLTLLGNATSIVSNNLIIGDSLIYLAANNYSGTDIVDIGFVANYANGTGANVHTGLIRDATTKQYYLFQGLDIELQANNQTFTPGANGVVNATLNADLVTNSITLNSQNIYSIINSSGAASNTWANTVGTAGNNYTNSVGIAGNNYASILAANNAISANNWANTLSTTDKAIANNYANTVGTAGNNYASILAANIAVGTNAYTVTVGAASNNWANSLNAKVYVSNTGPTSNVNGSLWWNSELGRLFVYYSDGDSNQWVQASPVTTSQSALANISNTFFAGNFYIPDGFTLGIGSTDSIAPLTISKSGVASVTLAGALIDADGTTNSYLQSAIRNANTGTSASTDWVATADDGTDTTNFIDLGINGSGFTSAGWTINGARDGYLYTIDSNLSIGSANSTSRTKYINFFVGGSLSSNEAMRIQDSSTGPNIGIGTTAPASKLDVNGLIRDSKGDVRDIPLNNQGTSYTLVLSDTGKVVSSTANVTVPNAVFSSGQAVTVYNNSASSITITQGGSVTVYLAGSATTGNRTLAQRGLATILNVAANTFVISGAGLT